ncbi:MAG: hypothetical protein HZB51_28985 [Chloroflexi bacterium]|nr:hypothetical protein [Chloroflexota bacterium]
MTHTYTARFTIRHYELNLQGELPDSTLQRLCQETAMQASADAGFGSQYYLEHKSVWVIHQMTLEHSRPIHYGDELAITTWVSDFQRVRSHREYLARNAATNEIVARGRAYWAHLNRETLMPTRIPGDLITLFASNGIRAVSRTQPRTFAALRFEFPDYRTTRHVFRYEADEMQHVNNAMYIDWLEEALNNSIADSLTSLRPGGAESAQSDNRLYVYRHDIEYARSAVPGDEVDIVVRLIGVGQTASAWKLEIMRNGDSLVKDHITALWVNNAGKPVRGIWQS